MIWLNSISAAKHTPAHYTLHSTVEDGSTGGAWIQKLHDFAKSQIAMKIYQEFASDYFILN